MIFHHAYVPKSILYDGCRMTPVSTVSKEQKMEKENQQTPFEITIPALAEVKFSLDSMRQEIKELKDWLKPKKEWYDLREASEIKGIPYGTLTARPWLKPNKGKPDGEVGGKARWRHSTIMAWITQTDEEMNQIRKLKKSA